MPNHKRAMTKRWCIPQMPSSNVPSGQWLQWPLHHVTKRPWSLSLLQCTWTPIQGTPPSVLHEVVFFEHGRNSSCVGGNTPKRETTVKKKKFHLCLSNIKGTLRGRGFTLYTINFKHQMSYTVINLNAPDVYLLLWRQILGIYNASRNPDEFPSKNCSIFSREMVFRWVLLNSNMLNSKLRFFRTVLKITLISLRR